MNDSHTRRTRRAGALALVLIVAAAGSLMGQAAALPEAHRTLADRLDVMKADLFEMSDWMYRNPEVGYHEFKTIEKMLAPLRQAGFTDRVGIAGFPSAFRAEKRLGTGKPTIAFVPMPDALRGPDDTAFHGCHHNLQNAATVGAALVLSKYMEEHALDGTIAVITYTAEEIPPPTINDMNAAGVYDDVDFVLEFHSAGATSRAAGGIGSCCSIPINAVRYTFSGRSVSANVPVKNLKSVKEQGSALEALLQLFANVRQVRQQVRPETIIQGVIAEGGEAPNVIPRKTVADFFIRFPADRPYVDQVTEKVNAAARQAADATGTEVQVDVYGKFYVGISLTALEDRAFRYEQAFGATGVQSEKGEPQGGMISQWVPGLSVRLQTSDGVSGHSLEMAEASILPLAHNGLLVAAKTMALVGYDLVSDAAFRQDALNEHRRWREELRKRGWLELVRRPGNTSATSR